jgi:predicted Zn-dependent peptidase
MTCDQSLKELEVALNQWLQSIKDGTLSKGELDAARESALSELAAQQGQNDLLAYQLSVQEVNQLPLTDLDQKRQKLLNVALADIQSAASTYFTPQRMTVAHILPMQEPAH